MRTTVSTFVVAACMCIMAVGGVNIDQYYCSKFGNATVYGQFYVVGGEDGVPQKPFDSLMLLLSSLLNETDEDTYSYSSGSLPPTVTPS